jgi:uncharacterized protein YndB with AHSA1/START domain
MIRRIGTLDAVRQTINVAATPERAFKVFTEELASWWPKDYSIGETDMDDFVIEPAAGGRWYEVGVDGAECETGRVIAYEPPHRLVLAWHLDADFRFDPDPAHASEVEVRFVADGADRTRVELEHRHFERHGLGAEAVRGAVTTRGGWGLVLAAFMTQFEA